jgi:hypothetical protein
MQTFTFDQTELAVVRRLCDTLVPGSREVGTEFYIDSILADAPPDVRGAWKAIVADLAGLSDDQEFRAHLIDHPAFGLFRAQSIQAYYSDFSRPGYVGPTAWNVTGFDTAPMASRVKKDWSFLRCYSIDDSR